MFAARFLDARIDYDGSQLAPGFAAGAAGLDPPCGVAFLGACDVEREHMVDMIDLEAGAAIRAREMLHLVVELPGADLERTTVWGRLLVALARDLWAERAGCAVRREGDDLYDGGGGSPGGGSGSPGGGAKLSVSVATAGPATGLIHLGLNVDASGAPVEAKGLADYRLDARAFGEELLARLAREYASVIEATGKVRRRA